MDSKTCSTSLCKRIIFPKTGIHFWGIRSRKHAINAAVTPVIDDDITLMDYLTYGLEYGLDDKMTEVFEQ